MPRAQNATDDEDDLDEEDDDEEEEGDEEDEDDDDDEDDDFSPRDFVMARLAAARNALQASIESIDESLALYVNPDDDAKGKERKELLDTAVESVGVASRCLEAAEETIGEVDFKEGEPWDEEPEPLPRARVRRR
jgi:hypothetical protein